MKTHIIFFCVFGALALVGHDGSVSADDKKQTNDDNLTKLIKCIEEVRNISVQKFEEVKDDDKDNKTYLFRHSMMTLQFFLEIVENNKLYYAKPLENMTKTYNETINGPLNNRTQLKIAAWTLFESLAENLRPRLKNLVNLTDLKTELLKNFARSSLDQAGLLQGIYYEDESASNMSKSLFDSLAYGYKVYVLLLRKYQKDGRNITTKLEKRKQYFNDYKMSLDKVKEPSNQFRKHILTLIKNVTQTLIDKNSEVSTDQEKFVTQTRKILQEVDVVTNSTSRIKLNFTRNRPDYELYDPLHGIYLVQNISYEAFRPENKMLSKQQICSQFRPHS